MGTSCLVGTELQLGVLKKSWGSMGPWLPKTNVLNATEPHAAQRFKRRVLRCVPLPAILKSNKHNVSCETRPGGRRD